MSKTEVESKTMQEQPDPISEAETRARISRKQFKIIHQMSVLIILHLLYIVFEAVDAFNEPWISAVVYGVLSAGTLLFVWSQWEGAKYFIPIPFVSLIIVGGVMEFSLVITIIFGLYCLLYFTMVFVKGSPLDAIITIISSGLAFFLLTIFMLFDRGFVQVNFEFNVVSGMLLLLTVGSSAAAIVHRNNLATQITYGLTLVIISSVLPFVEPESGYSSLFCLFCGLALMTASIISLTLIFMQEELALAKFLPFLIVTEAGIITFSYSFNFSFAWLDSQRSMLIVDYAIFIPLALYVAINLGVKYWKGSAEDEAKTRYAFTSESEKFTNDMLILGIFISFMVTSLVMFGWTEGNFNLIKALVVSVIFFGMSISLDFRASSISSLILVYVFLGLVLGFVAYVEYEIVLIILMSLSGFIILFALLNERFLAGEPLTTIMTLVGSLMFMVTLGLYFTFLSLWISLGWALLGLYLFAIGVLLEKILLRRTGLVIIIIDVLKSIYDVTQLKPKWLMGIGFMVLAVVLFICIYLFRWSEMRKGQRENSRQEGEEITSEMERLR